MRVDSTGNLFPNLFGIIWALQDSKFFKNTVRNHHQMVDSHGVSASSSSGGQSHPLGVTEVHRRRFSVGSSCVESVLSAHLDSLQFLPTFVKHAR